MIYTDLKECLLSASERGSLDSMLCSPRLVPEDKMGQFTTGILTYHPALSAVGSFLHGYW